MRLLVIAFLARHSTVLPCSRHALKPPTKQCGYRYNNIECNCVKEHHNRPSLESQIARAQHLPYSYRRYTSSVIPQPLVLLLGACCCAVAVSMLLQLWICF